MAQAQPRKVAALAVALDRRLEVDAAAALVALQRLLQNDARFEPVDLAALALGDARAQKAKKAGALRAESLTLLDQMNEKAALEKASEAIAAYEEADLTSAFPDLLDAIAARAFAFYSAGGSDEVKAELVRLFTLKADYEIDARRAPPAFAPIAAQARAQVAAARRASLEVRSSPVPAEVFVDGIYRGIAPVKVVDLALGSHYVTLRAPGYDLAQERRPIGLGAPWQMALRPAPSERGLLELIGNIKTRLPPGSGGSGGALARWAGADEVLIAGLQKKTDSTWASLALYSSEGRQLAAAEGALKKPEAIEELAREALVVRSAEPVAVLPPPPLPQPAPPPAVSASQVVAAPAAAPPGPAPSRSAAAKPVMGQSRASAYFGFGLGSGLGAFTVNGGSRSFSEPLHGSSVPLALQLEAGATLSPNVLLGGDLRLVRAQSTAGDVLVGLQMIDLTCMATWYPVQRGFFVRGGVGLAALGVKAASSDLVLGGGAVVGLGWAFWLGQQFNLTLNVDGSAALFPSKADRPSSSRFLDLYVGFGWY